MEKGKMVCGGGGTKRFTMGEEDMRNDIVKKEAGWVKEGVWWVGCEGISRSPSVMLVPPPPIPCLCSCPGPALINPDQILIKVNPITSCRCTCCFWGRDGAGPWEPAGDDLKIPIHLRSHHLEHYHLIYQVTKHLGHITIQCLVYSIKFNR